MIGLCVLMLIFAIILFLVGLYMFTGHKLRLLAWRPAYKHLKKEGWKMVGKWTMIISVLPLIVALIAFISDF